MAAFFPSSLTALLVLWASTSSSWSSFIVPSVDGFIMGDTRGGGFLVNNKRSSVSSTTSLSMSSSVASPPSSTTDSSGEPSSRKKLIPRTRYVATNRFAVRDGKEAKFEKRWATRKSRLATLDGFRHFHLMRRVTLNEDGTSSYDAGDKKADPPTSMGNYVSFTIWNEKKDFAAWRSGDAFKEAHGGTSITAFLSTMVNSALVLQGPPRPAFYDGLLSQGVLSEEMTNKPMEDGWRKLDDDVAEDLGTKVLPSECFVAMNQFFVPPENAAAFEERWKGRETTLKENDGFVAFNLLRRDGSAKGHGTVPVSDVEPSYTSATIWRDREAFEGWKSGQGFKTAHGGGGKPSGAGSKDDAATAATKPPAPLWSKPPVPVFYEGTLVISSPEGP